MLNGRHLLWIGILAAAGLVSVRDAQRQVTLGYATAEVENRLRVIREKVQTERVRFQTLQAPASVRDRIASLKLDLAPTSTLSLYSPSVPAAAGNAAQGPGLLSQPPASRPNAALNRRPVSGY